MALSIWGGQWSIGEFNMDGTRYDSLNQIQVLKVILPKKALINKMSPNKTRQFGRFLIKIISVVSMTQI